MRHNTSLTATLCAALAIVGFAACGDDAHSHDDDGDGHSHDTCGLQENCTDSLDFAHGLEVESEGGDYTVTIESGDPPSVADSAWMITIADADGNAVTDATLEVSAWSVDCHHSGPTAPEEVEANADGEYMVEPVFAHGGPWETRIIITDGSAMDEVHIPFCIPGDDHAGGTKDAGGEHAHH